MNIVEALVLGGVALLAGAINAVAGGGSVLTFPTLMLFGVSPIVANGTSTVALWPGSLASAWAYRRAALESKRWLWTLVATSAIGGTAGALIAIAMPPDDFRRSIPFMLLVASLLFTFGDSIRKRLGHHRAALSTVAMIQFCLSVYGGYFGGGMGLLMLALFAVVIDADLNALNGLKSILATAINGAAFVAFSVANDVDWPRAAVMVIGSVIGGYVMSHVALRAGVGAIKKIVMITSWIMTIVFFWKMW